MAARMTTIDDVAEFSISADRDGEITLECDRPGSLCWWGVAVDNGTTLAELAKLAAAHQAEAHPARPA
jgi:hypothetical protein